LEDGTAVRGINPDSSIDSTGNNQLHGSRTTIFMILFLKKIKIVGDMGVGPIYI